MSRSSARFDNRRSLLESLVAAVGFLLVIGSFFTQSQPLKSIGLALIFASVLLQVARYLLHALRTGRVAAVERSTDPAPYWSAIFGLSLVLLLLISIVWLALQD
jgi:hypothetical protein